MLSKEVSNTIFKVFDITRPGIEPRSPGTLVNTQPTVGKKGIEKREKMATTIFLKTKQFFPHQDEFSPEKMNFTK